MKESYPIMDLLEQFLYNFDKSCNDNEVKKFIKNFKFELFERMGNLSTIDGLLLFVDYLTSVQDKVHLSIVIGVERDNRSALIELYQSIHLAVRNELKRRGVL